MGEGCVKNPKKITIVVFKKSHLIFSDFQKEMIFLFKQNSFQIMTLLQNESKTSLIMTKNHQNWPSFWSIWRHIVRRDPNKFFCTYYSKLTSVLVHFEVWMLKKRPTLWCCRAALYPCRLFLNVNLLLTSNAW